MSVELRNRSSGSANDTQLIGGGCAIEVSGRQAVTSEGMLGCCRPDPDGRFLGCGLTGGNPGVVDCPACPGKAIDCCQAINAGGSETVSCASEVCGSGASGSPSTTATGEVAFCACPATPVNAQTPASPRARNGASNNARPRRGFSSCLCVLRPTLREYQPPVSEKQCLQICHPDRSEA